ncbi:MAG: hypothetical protein ACI4I9_04585, partial [Porcipelethomonas sp.]
MYNPTEWKDHLRSSQSFKITSNDDGTFNITPAGEVIQQGTKMSAEHFNNIENGISELDIKMDNIKTLNLCHNTKGTWAKNGLTFTYNEDGSVTVNGTATAATYYVFEAIPYENINYIAHGCPAGGGNSSYSLDIAVDSASGTRLYNLHDYGSGVIIPDSYSNAATIMPNIAIASGQTVDNLTFYPMIEPGTVKHEYIPCTGTKTQLNECVAQLRRNTSESFSDIRNNIALNRTVIGAQQKNLLKAVNRAYIN